MWVYVCLCISDQVIYSLWIVQKKTSMRCANLHGSLQTSEVFCRPPCNRGNSDILDILDIQDIHLKMVRTIISYAPIMAARIFNDCYLLTLYSFSPYIICIYPLDFI